MVYKGQLIRDTRQYWDMGHGTTSASTPELRDRLTHGIIGTLDKNFSQGTLKVGVFTLQTLQTVN